MRILLDCTSVTLKVQREFAEETFGRLVLCHRGQLVRSALSLTSLGISGKSMPALYRTIFKMSASHGPQSLSIAPG